MNDEGWIKLHRKLANNDMWLEEPFSRGQAWVDLLMMVNHKSARVLFDGKLVTIGKGSRITSIRALCKRWRWSNTKVTSFLALLEAEKMLLRRSDTKKTVLTIVNYGKYQDVKDEKTPQKRRRNVTETPQKHTNKNEKNDKNEKNIKKEKSADVRLAPPALIERLKQTNFDDMTAEEREVWLAYMRR